MPFYLGRKAIRKVPGRVIKAAPIPRFELIQGFGKRELVGKLCALLSDSDYDKLTRMIDADSVNYSPSITLTDSEIRMLLDQIRRGY